MQRFKNKKPIFICLIALLISVLILASSFAFGRGNKARGPFSFVYNYIERPVAVLIDNTFVRIKGVFSYNEIRDENEKLKDRISKLEYKLSKEKTKKQDLDTLKELSEALSYDFIKSNDDIVTCDIISISGKPVLNLVTVNKGSDAGVRKNDIVLAGKALFGRVVQTGRSWAKIAPITDRNLKVGFIAGSDDNVIGMINASKGGKLLGYMLSDKTEISVGEDVFTTGIGDYPPNILIGRVIGIDYNSGNSLVMVKIKPYVNFDKPNKVTIIK